MFTPLTDMSGNLDQRKINRHEIKDLIVSTVLVTDSEYMYETAIQSLEYNNNQWIVVENYNTKYEAQIGHEKWVILMTSNNLPESLTECSKSCWNMLGEKTFMRQKIKKNN